MNHADAGARVVAGTVAVADWQDRSDGVRERAVSDYLATPHRHIHGANLSFAATAYQAAGGFPPIPSSEDVALVDAFRRNDEPIAWALDLAVRTSARRQARAPRRIRRLSLVAGRRTRRSQGRPMMRSGRQAQPETSTNTRTKR